MKIKFIKEYRAFQDFEGSFEASNIYKVGDTKDVDTKAAQWLIDNGFAEEAKESGTWEPKKGDRYYFIDSSGYIKHDTWDNTFWEVDRYMMSNAFKTKTAAERYSDYLRAIATVRQDEGVLTPEQGMKGSYVYCIYDNNEFGPVVHKYYAVCTPVNTVLFDTSEHAQDSLDKHPDEWKIIANYDWSRE